MAVMADGSFPFGAVGLVHLENSITQHRPIGVDEALDLSVRPTPLQPHPKGRTFSLITEARVGEELAWESASTMLRRGKGDDSSAATGELSPFQPTRSKKMREPRPSGSSGATWGAAMRRSRETATRSTCTR